MANVRITMRQAAIGEFLHSPSGPIYREVASRVRKTEAIATATAPVGKTGRLKSNRDSGIRDEGDRLVGFVSFKVFYAIYHAKGTGIYGDRGRRITAKGGGVLVFRTKDGTLIRTKSVKGIPPNPWLVNALKAGAGGWPVTEH